MVLQWVDIQKKSDLSQHCHKKSVYNTCGLIRVSRMENKENTAMFLASVWLMPSPLGSTKPSNVPTIVYDDCQE